jgi:hypothetical protein
MRGVVLPAASIATPRFARAYKTRLDHESCILEIHRRPDRRLNPCLPLAKTSIPPPMPPRTEVSGAGNRQAYLIIYSVVALHAKYASAWWAAVVKGLLIGLAYAASLLIATLLIGIWTIVE